jgi:Transglycosylase SLT domain
MRLTRALVSCALLFAAAPSLRAEYIALRSGQRLHVTGYQVLGDKYRLQMAGGVVEVPVEEVVSIDPEDTFAPLPTPIVETAPLHEIVKAAAARYRMDADLILSVIAAESNFDAKAVSKKNARGLMQLLPETAARFGVHDIFDPQENIDAGTHYLSDLLQHYHNDLALALAAYNAGPVRVQQFGRVPPYPETVSYVRRVKRGYEKSKAGMSLEVAPKTSSKKTTPSPVASSSTGVVASQLSISN